MSLTIGKKLFIGVGTLIVFTFALGITAIYSVSTVGEKLHTVVNKTVKKAGIAYTLQTEAADMLSVERGMVVRGFMKDPAKMQTYHQDFIVLANQLDANLNELEPMLILPETKQIVKEIQASIPDMRSANDAVFQAAMAGDMTQATLIYNQAVLPPLQRQTIAAQKVLELQQGLMATDAQSSEATVSFSIWSTAILLILSCLVGIVVVFVVRQINKVLRQSVLEMAEASVQIAAAAGQVASSSQSLAQGSSEQAATIEETSSASAEINSMASRNTENSRSTAEIVLHSQEGFERTNHSLTEMVGAMEAINNSSQKISKIIKVIDEIAFQTNILALNAAVEAARAGEAGMGFAVVADEVRNLAQRCAQAAKDTADLIEESIENSNSGRVKVDQVAVALREITGESGKIKVLVDEINLGSIEQSRGIDQISRSITQMEQVTQSSAANAEEGAAAAQELNSQAETMKDVVEGLRVLVDGHSIHLVEKSSRARVKQPHAA